MLTALRRLTGTWVAKALFGLLILSFAAWGIEDVLRNFGRDTAIARVDGVAIEAEEAEGAARRELGRITRNLGREFQPDATIRRAVATQAVEALVQDRLLRAEAERLGLAAPDAAVVAEVRDNAGFRGGDGGFSRPVFEAFLRGNGITERYFMDVVRSDLLRRQLVDAVRAGARPPPAMVEPLTAWALETRAAVVVEVLAASQPAPEPADEATLRRFQANEAGRFSSAELRDAELVVMSADRLMREVVVPDGEIEAAFEARRAQFETPERRRVSQLLVADEAAAAALAEAWRAGAAAAELEARAGSAVIDLGTVERGGLPFPELAEAAFGLAAPGVAGPVRTPFGWHVLGVAEITPGEQRTLDDVRETLRGELAGEKAADLAFERANRVEDALAGGATLAEVAERFNLGHATVVVDAGGRDAAGAVVALPVIEASREPLLRAVFAAVPGAAPRLAETEAGFVAVALRAVTPPALRPFESVVDAVTAAWVAAERRRASETVAAGLLGASRGAASPGGAAPGATTDGGAGQSGPVPGGASEGGPAQGAPTERGATLADAAVAAGLGWREVGAIGRDPAAAAVPRELVPPLFRLRRGDVTMVATEAGFAVAQLLEVAGPAPDALAARAEPIRAQLAELFAGDLEALYLAALRARADVRINPRLLDRLAQP